MDRLNIGIKQNGDTLEAQDFNSVVNKINELVEDTNSGSNTNDPHIYFDGLRKHNFNIVTTAEDQYEDENNKVKGGKINIEPYTDLQIKAGDDITLYSHHREDPEELSIKVLNGAKISATDLSETNEYPVDLLLNMSNIVLTTKDKAITITEKNKKRQAEATTNNTEYTPTKDAENILNMEIKTGIKAKKATASNGQYGYLKVRANAIDLRCEDHGGIALLPKGYDSEGNMNKIKFEHGGGDGLEFGTFNTEKSSLFTNEYRFNKNGEIYLATRKTEASGKTDDGVFDNNGNKPATNEYKYVKQADDFYDVIDANDPHCTWGDIITYIAWAKANNQGPWAL